MNSIFRKTLIATALSTILTTAAIAAEDYQETIDGDISDREHSKSSMNDISDSNMHNNHHNQIDGKSPCNGDMKVTGNSRDHDTEKHDADDRTLTEHQGDVTHQNSDTEATYKSHHTEVDHRDAQGRLETDLQLQVTE